MTDIKKVWQSQKAEGDMVAPDDLRARAGKFRTRFRWRNILIGGYSVFALVSFARWFVIVLHRPSLPPFFPIVVLAALAQAWILFALWWRGRARPLPDTLAGEEALGFYRRELEHQRAFVASAWAWYILPCLPPYVGFAWIIMQTPHMSPSQVMFSLIMGISYVFFFGAIWLAFSRSAARLDLELERLKRLRVE